MDSKEKRLLESVCERCRHYRTYKKCEVQNLCPVYELYIIAKKNTKLVDCTSFYKHFNH